MDMLNAVKTVLADVSSVSPSSEQKTKSINKLVCSEVEALTCVFMRVYTCMRVYGVPKFVNFMRSI